MQCEKFETLWNDALDARQSPEDHPALVEHAASCRHCAALLSGTELLLQGLDARPEVTASADFAEKVLAAFHRPPARFSRRARLVAAFALAAAILIAVGLALQFNSPDQSSPAPSTSNFAHQETADEEPFVIDAETIETAEQLAPVLTALPGLNDDYLAMFRETGTAVALFPDQIRRASHPEETGVVVDRIRPVTQPVTAALNALRRTLPVSGSNLPDPADDAKSSHFRAPLEAQGNDQPWT